VLETREAQRKHQQQRTKTQPGMGTQNCRKGPLDVEVVEGA
jgi:hypothetical protein